jgi:hypothetical protein
MIFDNVKNSQWLFIQPTTVGSRVTVWSNGLRVNYQLSRWYNGQAVTGVRMHFRICDSLIANTPQQFFLQIFIFLTIIQAYFQSLYSDTAFSGKARMSTTPWPKIHLNPYKALWASWSAVGHKIDKKKFRLTFFSVMFVSEKKQHFFLTILAKFATFCDFRG